MKNSGRLFGLATSEWCVNGFLLVRWLCSSAWLEFAGELYICVHLFAAFRPLSCGKLRPRCPLCLYRRIFVQMSYTMGKAHSTMRRGYSVMRLRTAINACAGEKFFFSLSICLANAEAPGIYHLFLVHLFFLFILRRRKKSQLARFCRSERFVHDLD